ncbi:MAG: hypothetical protein SU899_05285 [Chloroflexota bacterium]|nr:hypothetical protein [Chloroflexota bacterium]
MHIEVRFYSPWRNGKMGQAAYQPFRYRSTGWQMDIVPSGLGLANTLSAPEFGR